MRASRRITGGEPSGLLPSGLNPNTVEMSNKLKAYIEDGVKLNANFNKQYDYAMGNMDRLKEKTNAQQANSEASVAKEANAARAANAASNAKKASNAKRTDQALIDAEDRNVIEYIQTLTEKNDEYLVNNSNEIFVGLFGGPHSPLLNVFARYGGIRITRDSNNTRWLNLTYYDKTAQVVEYRDLYYPLIPNKASQAQGGGKKAKPSHHRAKWTSTKRKVVTRSGAKKTLYRCAATGETRVKRMVERNGVRVATYVRPYKIFSLCG